MIKSAAAIFQLIIFLAVLYFFYLNIPNATHINFIKNMPFYETSTAFVIIAAYIAGILTGLMQSIVNKSFYRNQIEFYARKNEKLAQQNEIDTDDKEALERKIAALEIALQNALKNKN